jgi:cell division protein FtsB
MADGGRRTSQASAARSKGARDDAEKAASPDGAEKAASPDGGQIRSMGGRAAVRLALVLVLVIGALFAFVFPTRAYLDQHRQTNTAAQRLELLRKHNAQLAAERKRLESDAEVQRIARERYNLVLPGEKAYAVVPGTTAPAAGAPGSPNTTVPPAAQNNDVPGYATATSPPAPAPTTPTTAKPH